MRTVYTFTYIHLRIVTVRRSTGHRRVVLSSVSVRIPPPPNLVAMHTSIQAFEHNGAHWLLLRHACTHDQLIVGVRVCHPTPSLHTPFLSLSLSPSLPSAASLRPVTLSPPFSSSYCPPTPEFWVFFCATSLYFPISGMGPLLSVKLAVSCR